jgi:hypothetical protein
MAAVFLVIAWRIAHRAIRQLVAHSEGKAATPKRFESIFDHKLRQSLI